MIIGIDASRANLRERTGTEQYSFQILKNLVAADRKNRYVLYLKDEPLDDLRSLGPNVTFRVLRWPPRYLWSQIRLSLEMLVHRPDVLFIPAHTIPIIHPRNTVTTIHDLGFERNIDLYGKHAIGGRNLSKTILTVIARIMTLGRYGASELDYHRWSARFAASHARHLITVSEFSKQEIVQRYGVDANRISVIHHGFDAVTYRRPSKPEIDRVLAMTGVRRPYVTFVGRLERKKNVLALVKAFAEARTSLPALTLVLIGKIGFGWDEAASFITQRRLQSSVQLLGWQPNDSVASVIAGAQALVFLSEYEGFGMPILESFAIGTPVIGARKGSIPEVSGEAALLVDPHDPTAVAQAIERVTHNADIKERLIALGLERARSFSWKTAAEDTLAVLTAGF